MAVRRRPARAPATRRQVVRKRDGNRRGKEQTDDQRRDPELDVFDRRLQWFRELHTDRTGCVQEEARLRAIEHAAKLGRTPLRVFDPGGSAPRRGFELSGTEKIKAQLRRGRNPRPNSSFGFASQAVEVRSGDDLRGVTLKLAIDKEMASALDVTTARVFRFEKETGDWQMVARSGASLNGDYAWARINREGLYLAIALPCDWWLINVVSTIDRYTPWLRAARELNATERVLDDICKVILCGDVFEKVRGDPELADRVGLPPFEGGMPGNICERCLGLDVPIGGLPEGQILRDPPIIVDPWIPCFPWPKLCTRWVSAGPVNINGRIKSLAIHPSNGNIVYAGGADGGVWKTTDGGISWYATMQLELSMAIGGLGIAASNANVLYAATGENVPGWGPSYPGVGVYKTTDGGGDWDLMAAIASNRCSRVLVHPTNPNTVYVAGNGGLHKSTDGGASWTNVRTDFLSDALMDPTAPNTLYAAVWNSGVYKSTDGGVSWTLLSTGIPTGSSAEWIKLAMGRFGTNGTNFLVAKMGLDSGVLYKSTNGGTSWTQIPGTHQAVSYNEWTNMVAVGPNNQNVIFAGGVGIERSSNGGTSFVGIGGTHSDHHQIVFNPTDSDTCYMATDGGVYRSTDNGQSWILQSQGLICTQLYSIGVAQTTPFVVGSGTQDQGIVKGTGGSTWSDTGAGNEGGFFVVDPNNSSNIYVTPWSTNLRRSTNGGASWTTILTGITTVGTPPQAVGIYHLAVKPGDSNLLLCVGGGEIFRSTNQGTNWSSVKTVVGIGTRVAFSASNPSIAYATTGAGRVYKSTTSGASASWTEPYSASPPSKKPPAGWLSAIGVSWTNSNLVYIAYGGTGMAHVYKSSDGGVTWSNASGVLPSDALPDIPVSALVVDQYNPEVVYVSTDIGVFRTRDGGDSWEPFEDGMPRIVTSELALKRSTNTLYASTMGRGAYKREL